MTMRLPILTAMLILGLSGCVTTSDVSCEATKRDRQLLKEGLLAHPETADAVGEPATDLLIGLKGLCPR